MLNSTIFSHLLFIILLVGTVSGESEFQQVALSRHNFYRTKHDTEDLVASDDLNERAMMCAEYYAEKGQLDHSCPYTDNDVGENIWAHYGGRRTSNDDFATRSVDKWYSEESKYKYAGRQSGTGHFTQVVWKGSREFGIGVAKKGRMSVAVALYSPPGNFLGEYEKNVKRPSSDSAIPEDQQLEVELIQPEEPEEPEE